MCWGPFFGSKSFPEIFVRGLSRLPRQKPHTVCRPRGAPGPFRGPLEGGPPTPCRGLREGPPPLGPRGTSPSSVGADVGLGEEGDHGVTAAGATPRDGGGRAIEGGSLSLQPAVLAQLPEGRLALSVSA